MSKSAQSLVAAGLFAHRKSWTAMGPFDLGAFFKPVAVLCPIGCAVLLFIGIQPPNDKALTMTTAALVLAAAVWFGFERRRFAGAPIGDRARAKAAEIAAAERAVEEA